MEKRNFNIRVAGFNISNKPIINTSKQRAEERTIPLILDPELKSSLEKDLGHSITTLGDFMECFDRGILKELDPAIERKILAGLAEPDQDEIEGSDRISDDWSSPDLSDGNVDL